MPLFSLISFTLHVNSDAFPPLFCCCFVYLSDVGLLPFVDYTQGFLRCFKKGIGSLESEKSSSGPYRFILGT